MTDTTNNGSRASAAGETASAKPKRARKPAAGTTKARISAAQTTSAKRATAGKAKMADETRTSTASAGADESALRARLQEIEDRARELQRWALARQEQAREVVEERPLAVVGTAFGVGLLLGLMMSRL